MKKRLTLSFIFIFLLSISVAAHETEEEITSDHSNLYPLSQLALVGYGSIAFAILSLVIILFHKVMDDMIKRVAYILIVLLVSIVTIYLIITTLHLNAISETKGPVHWHADFEVLICDQKIELASPKGIFNKQGTELLHAHVDNRIHVEGVLLDNDEASIGAFFNAAGGSLSSDGIKVPTDEGLVAVHNGDLCNGKPGKLYVFLNGNPEPLENPSKYIIAPYETVPPGDRIKIVFTEKPRDEINPYIAGDEGLPPHLTEPKTGIPQQIIEERDRCDLDGDFDCDGDDLHMFESYIGSCVIFDENGDGVFKGNYNPSADIDGDNCVTQLDKEYFLQSMEQYNQNKNIQK